MSLTFEKANKIYDSIEASTLTCLKTDLYKKAIRYANIRAAWEFYTTDEKREKDHLRTSAHNVFIGCCNIFSRNQNKIDEDNSWRKELGNNRIRIGDFACYIHLIVSIKNRQFIFVIKDSI